MAMEPDAAPFATFILPAFNQERFIEASMWAMLAQKCPPSEVLVADDCSTDRTFSLVTRIVSAYEGPHRVTATRNLVNEGSGNMIALSRRASSRYVVVFHGDDVSRPDRAARLVETLKATGASLVSSNAQTIDADGHPLDLLVDQKESGFLNVRDVARSWARTQTGATHAFDRVLVEDFLPWSHDSYWYAGDHILPFRAALLGGCYFLDEVLLDRRQHANNQGKDTVGRAGVNSAEDPLVRREWRAARLLSTRSFMLRDLEAYAAAHGETERTREARAELHDTISETLTVWSQSRSCLLNGGQRPIWVSREEYTKKRSDPEKASWLSTFCQLMLGSLKRAMTRSPSCTLRPKP